MTRPQDAAAAAAAGADAIGMVFHRGSTRYVTPEMAEEIIAQVPPIVSVVGLFVDSAVDDVLHLARRLHLQFVQFHGHETPDMLEALDEFRVLKAVRVDREQFAETLKPWHLAVREGRADNLAGILLETAGTAQPGGTGVENDWAYIRSAIDSGMFEGLPPIIAAGGLTPETVGNVVRQLQPWAVDVSSGIESSRGIKSIEKMNQFARAVREADEANAI